MKKFTALIAAAILALSISVPVYAEEESDIQSDVSVVAESTESANDSENENSLEESTENESEVSEKSAEKPKKVYYTDYAIPEAEMYISFPNDMYVLTRDIDIDSPVLKAAGMTKTELIKNFEQTGNYIKASAADFTYEVVVNILKDENTKTIGEISNLSDKEIQTITDNQLAQPMYNKGCSRTVYNNVMYLSFPFEYTEGKTKIAGVQKYTIAKGARIVITFQSYTGEISEDFDELIVSVMDRVLYDGVSPQIETSADDKKSSEITNLDVRYIYILLTALVALIFLMLIIVTAMKYKKSRKKSLPEPVVEEKKEIPETPEEKKEEEIPEKEEISKEEPVPEKAEPKEEMIPEKSDETPKEEAIPEKKEEVPVKEETAKKEVKKDEENLPVVESQLELVEIAFRIIPELTPENEDMSEIWNFIYKKYDDMEFFASHGNKNYGNANAFYRINANSNIIPPPEKKENIDDEIRNETLENVVGDSKPDELKSEEPPAEDKTDMNELVGGESGEEKSETDSAGEIYKADEKSADTEKNDTSE